MSAAELKWHHACVMSLGMLFACTQTGSATEWAKVTELHLQQAGNRQEGTPASDPFLLANEPGDAQAYLCMDVDLEQLSQTSTPLARLRIPSLTKVPTKRPGRKVSTTRGALHAFACLAGDLSPRLIGSTPVKPAGIPTPYVIDVTIAVNDALRRPLGQRKVRMDLRMTGLPSYYEVYAVAISVDKTPFLEVAPAGGWTSDWEQRLEPLCAGPLVYHEACMPMTADRNMEAMPPLLYPVKRIVEVVHNGTGEKLQEGRDWLLRDGKLVLPPGTHAPVNVEKEFFARQPKPGERAVTIAKPQSIVLLEGTWYHERQMEVTYEPASRDWEMPVQPASLDRLPRLQRLLSAKAPVRLILFGDSISLGGNASKFEGAWPYQPNFGELVAWRLERRTGSRITFMNHARGGAGAAYGAGQAESQVGWFKPDLVLIGFGMNDRSPERQKTFRADMEKIIDTIRAVSPETEFVVVTPMLNNPKQPDKGEAILVIRDETLKIRRSGLVFADVTSVELALLKHKNYLDFSGNGANHPNDFIHRIYAQCILDVLASPVKKK